MPNNEKQIRTIAATILRIIERPVLRWDQAELLAKCIVADLTDEDYWIVKLPNDGKHHSFENPKGNHAN